MKTKQSGVSLSGLLMASVLLAMVALLGIKVVPDVIEYFQIVKAIKSISEDQKAQESIVEVRKAFDRRANINNISTITGQDLDVSKDRGNLIISFNYEKRTPLFGNVSLLIEFQGSNEK